MDNLSEKTLEQLEALEENWMKIMPDLTNINIVRFVGARIKSISEEIRRRKEEECKQTN